MHEVVGDTGKDIFNGLAVSPGFLRSPRYVPAERVGALVEGRVEVDLGQDEFDRMDEHGDVPPSAEIRSDTTDLSSSASSRASAAAPAASAAITRQVSSPASVPTTSGCSDRSSARAIAPAVPTSALITTMFCGRADPAAVAAQDRGERVTRIGRPRAPREQVARQAQPVPHLLDSELAQIPRQRRLRDDAARGRKRRPELLLRADAAPSDHALDQLLALRLAEPAPAVLHKAQDTYADGAQVSQVCRNRGQATSRPCFAKPCGRVCTARSAQLRRWRPGAQRPESGGSRRARSRPPSNETKGDRIVEGGADKLETLADKAAAKGGVAGKLADELAEDAASSAS